MVAVLLPNPGVFPATSSTQSPGHISHARNWHGFLPFEAHNGDAFESESEKLRFATLVAVLMATIEPVGAQQMPREQASADLLGRLVEQVNDSGLVVEIVVKCSHGTVGIMHYDRTAGNFLCSKGAFHTDFVRSWMSTCNFGFNLD